MVRPRRIAKYLEAWLRQYVYLYFIRGCNPEHYRSRASLGSFNHHNCLQDPKHCVLFRALGTPWPNSVSEIEEKRSTCDKCATWINLIVAVVVFASLLGGWIPFVVAQANGTIFKSYYSNCPHHDLKNLFGDGECYGGPLLTPECAFENGDCLDLHNKFPLSNFTEVLHPNEEFDNGKCNPLLNSFECGWD